MTTPNLVIKSRNGRVTYADSLPPRKFWYRQGGLRGVFNLVLDTTPDTSPTGPLDVHAVQTLTTTPVSRVGPPCPLILFHAVGTSMDPTKLRLETGKDRDTGNRSPETGLKGIDASFLFLRVESPNNTVSYSTTYVRTFVHSPCPNHFLLTWITTIDTHRLPLPRVERDVGRNEV